MSDLTPYQQSALRFDKHIALTANAGSGKTFVFSKRFVKILLEKEIGLNEIVAITFTEKAAAELYTRIANELNSELNKTADDKLIRKLQKLRNRLVSAHISTIHSFCFDLLKEYAPIAGLDSNLVLVDSSAASEIKEKEIAAYIDGKLNQENSFEIKNLIRICGSKSVLIKHFKSGFNKVKIVSKIWNDLYSKDKEEIVNHFDDEVEKLFKLVVDPEINSITKKIVQLNDEVLTGDPSNSTAAEVKSILNKLNSETEPASIAAYFEAIKNYIFTKQNNLRSRGYLNKSVNLFRIDEKKLSDFFDTIAIFNSSEDEKSLHYSLAEFGKIYLSSTLDIVNSYNDYKRANGFLDYDDLILITEELLTNAEVRKALAERYKFIMIDEYQDTDDSQFNIFTPILNQLKSGNLFVVGDEKQSIYMFRDADLKVFDKTRRLINSTSGSTGIMALPHSFRLSPKIAFFCNKLFAQLMSNPILSFNEVQYSDLITTRKDVSAGEIGFLLCNEEDEITEESLVCKKIIHLVETDGLQFKDIAILVRKRSSFASLEKQLLNTGIPYSIIGGRGFYEQQEIYDIHNYLQFLIDPTNDAALVGILRSPFFQLSDADLFRISYNKSNTFWGKLKRNADENEMLQKVVQKIEQHLLDQNQLDIAELIRKIIIDTNYLAVIAAQDNSNQKIANINKLINRAKNFNKSQLTGLYDFVEKLGELIDLVEDEGQAQPSGDGDAVNLMTIHQSKGLEFKAVFLFNSHQRSNTDIIKSRSITIDKEYGILTKLPINENYFSEFSSAPIVKAGNYKSMKQSVAEIKRLLYVGLTRAEDYLYISGDVSKAVPSSSFLGLIKESFVIESLEDGLELNGTIDYMFKDAEEYKTKKMNIDLSIEKNVNLSLANRVAKENHEGVDIDELNINVNSIESTQKNEIISATKMNMFLQCPLKYNLTYNLGYIDIHNTFAQKNNDFFDKEDDDLTLPANIKGSIIHGVLEKDIKGRAQIEAYISNQLDKIFPNRDIAFSIDHVVEEIQTFYSSDVYNKISCYTNYENEFEIYAKLNDFYIYGILDKYIMTDKTAVIVDYKTDLVNEKNSKAKFNYYRSQLLFYCLLLSKYKNVKSDIEVRLVFVSKPELSISGVISLQEIDSFSDMVCAIVNRIRNNEFGKNLEHCNACQYSINNNCVVK